MSLIPVNCLIRGNDPNLMVIIEVNPNGKISLLKELIKVKMEPSLDHIPAPALSLWKVDFALDDPRLRNFACDGEVLLPVKRLSMFKNLHEEHVHVIIKLPGMSQ